MVATIHTYSGPDADIVLDAARTRLAAYVADWHRLGRDVTRSGIFAALHVDGVQNVDLIRPAADLIVSRQAAPYCTGVTVTFAGVGE